MYYVVSGKVVWSAHRSEETALRNAVRLSAKWPYRFRVTRIRHRWQPGDNPAPRYYAQ